MGQLGHCSLQAGEKELIPRRVVALDGIFIKDVACGGVHTCAVTEIGALYAWGGGQVGQLGLGPQSGFFSCIANQSESFLRNIPALVVPNGVQLVACGHSHTLISTRDGRIHGWGYNSYGQAANDKSTYAWYPSPVDWYGKVILLGSFPLVIWFFMFMEVLFAGVLVKCENWQLVVVILLC